MWVGVLLPSLWDNILKGFFPELTQLRWLHLLKCHWFISKLFKVILNSQEMICTIGCHVFKIVILLPSSFFGSSVNHIGVLNAICRSVRISSSSVISLCSGNLSWLCPSSFPTYVIYFRLMISVRLGSRGNFDGWYNYRWFPLCQTFALMNVKWLRPQLYCEIVELVETKMPGLR